MLCPLQEFGCALESLVSHWGRTKQHLFSSWLSCLLTTIAPKDEEPELRPEEGWFWTWQGALSILCTPRASGLCQKHWFPSSIVLEPLWWIYYQMERNTLPPLCCQLHHAARFLQNCGALPDGSGAGPPGTKLLPVHTWNNPDGSPRCARSTFQRLGSHVNRCMNQQIWIILYP